MIKLVKKGEVLQREGERACNFYRVRKGLLRSYKIDKRGKEHIFMFGPEGWIIVDSADCDEPAHLFIDALEDSEVDIVDKSIFLKGVTNQDLSFSSLLTKRIYTLQKRVIMLMSATAIERYEHFVETYPQITQRVSQRMIASYLGITPEALSKVKGDKARRK